MEGDSSLLVDEFMSELTVVGSWMEKDRASRGDGEPPSSKRQRVAPRHQDSEDESERSPLLSSRPPQPRRRSPPRPLHRTPFKSKVNTAEGSNPLNSINQILDTQES